MEELGFDYVWSPGWEGIKKKKKKKEQLLIEPSARVKGNRGVRQLVPAKRKRKEEKKGVSQGRR